ARGLADEAGRLLQVGDEALDAGPGQGGQVDDGCPLLDSSLRLHAGEVDLVSDDRDLAVAVGGASGRERRGERLTDVGDPEHAIRARDLEPRAPDAFALDGVVRLAEPRRVDDGHRQAVERQMLAQRIARRPGYL